MSQLANEAYIPAEIEKRKLVHAKNVDSIYAVFSYVSH